MINLGSDKFTTGKKQPREQVELRELKDYKLIR
jgi:hypothetical protein